MYLTWRTAALTALGVVPAILTASGGVAWAWLLLTLAVASVDAALAPPPRSIGIKREPNSTVRLTSSTTSRVVVVNTGTRAMRGQLRDAWQPSAGALKNRHALAIPPGEMRRFSTELTPTRRGDLNPAHITLRASGPLGLAGKQMTVNVPGRLRVLPEFASRKHLPSRLARLRELDGRSAVQLRGPGSEFDSLREYVDGDDVRSIDWRATARRETVVIRTWRPERDRHVVIMLDTSRTSAARIGDTPRLDASIEAALLLSALASHAGDRVQVIAFDREIRARVTGATSTSVMPALAEQLAPVQPSLIEMDWTSAVTTLQELTSQRALIVLLTSLDASSIDSGMLRALAPLNRKHQLAVASVNDPEIQAMVADRSAGADLMSSAAATRYELERQAVAVRLRHAGIEVVHRSPDDLAPAVADMYLALKAAGKL